jgi:hypothetical protein
MMWPWWANGEWREVLELELGAGGGACNGALGDANTDAGGRGFTVVDGGMLAEVDSGGTSVSYSGVVDGKVGWIRDGWLQDKERAKASL